MKKMYLNRIKMTGLLLFAYLQISPLAALEVNNNGSNVILDIHIEDIRDTGGKVYLAVFSKEPDNFPYETTGNKNTVYRKVYNVKSDQIVDQVALPEGAYVIALFHDINSNKQLDLNMLGIPVEGHAFSNNCDTSRGKFTYKDLEFSLSGKKVIQTLKMVYLYEK